MNKSEVDLEKEEIKIFSSSYLSRLSNNLSSEGALKLYNVDEFLFEKKYAPGHSGIFLDYDLKLDPDDDLRSSILLYSNLELDETQASDPRLWTFLTHVRFWDYMNKRWPIYNSLNNPENRVKSRYFLLNLNLRTLTRNGLSRLWWYAHLTVDESRQDKYALTRIMLSRADLTVGITERALGSSSVIRTSLLEFLQQYPEIRDSEDKSRKLLTGLNLAGGSKPLSFLSKDNVNEILYKIKKTL